MPIYPLGPGAWRTADSGAALLAGLNPPVKPLASQLQWEMNSALHPIAKANATDLNPNPHRHGLDADTARAIAGSPAALDPRSAVRQWLGIDPPWVYTGSDALAGQALRRTLTKIVRAGEPGSGTQQPPLPGLATPPETRAPVRANALWRWGRPFRISAIVAELNSRLWLGPDASLHRIGPDVASKGWKPQLLWSVTPLSTAASRVEQVDKVLRAAVEREERMPEILSQMQDFRAFFDAITGLDRERAPYLYELIDTAWQWAEPYVMAVKNRVNEDRPFQRDALVGTVIPTPPHGSLPSGHATMATLTSELLIRVVYQSGTSLRIEQCDRLARRIAFNRVVAGVHFPMDSAVGYDLGRQLAAYLDALSSPKKEDRPAPEPLATVVHTASALNERGPRLTRGSAAEVPSMPGKQEAVVQSAGTPSKIAPAPLLTLLRERVDQELDAWRI